MLNRIRVLDEKYEKQNNYVICCFLKVSDGYKKLNENVHVYVISVPVGVLTLLLDSSPRLIADPSFSPGRSCL